MAMKPAQLPVLQEPGESYEGIDVGPTVPFTLPSATTAWRHIDGIQPQTYCHELEPWMAWAVHGGFA